MMKEDVIRLNEQLKGKKAEEVLDYFLEKYQGHIALASSLGIEDQGVDCYDLRDRCDYPYFYFGHRAVVS